MSFQPWFKCFTEDGLPLEFFERHWMSQWSFPIITYDMDGTVNLTPGQWQVCRGGNNINVVQYLDPLVLSNQVCKIYVVEVHWKAVFRNKVADSVRLIAPVPDGRFENQFGVYYFKDGKLHDYGEIPAVTLANGRTFKFYNGIRVI